MRTKHGAPYRPDDHTKDAAAAGEASVRLHLVAAWRESTVFAEAERAALVFLVSMINAANRSRPGPRPLDPGR